MFMPGPFFDNIATLHFVSGSFENLLKTTQKFLKWPEILKLHRNALIERSENNPNFSQKKSNIMGRKTWEATKLGLARPLFIYIYIYIYIPEAIQRYFFVYFLMILNIIYIYSYVHLCIYKFIHLHINILKPFRCLNSVPRQVFCINFSRRI